MNGSAERLSPAPGPQELAEIEAALKSAWTGANSTPYLVEAPIDSALRARAEHAVRTRRLSNLFFTYPTLATWGVLTPLALSYGPDREVYSHIGAFTGERFDDVSSRDDLKQRYRTAARKLGLPVRGNDPTSLFFGPLGPARAHHRDLAEAFVAAALSLGPPAIEDTPSARGWQRRAVAMRCQQIARLCATVAFDQSAWLATRFEAWRRRNAPISDGEAHLFAAYETATRAFGRRRSDIVGPPRLAWTGFGLAFEPEASSKAQSLRFGAFATPIAGGGRVALPAPWHERIAWTCGGVSSEISAGPGPGEVLVFDEAGGVLLGRLGAEVARADLPAERHVVMARQPFTATSFGPAIPAEDPSCFLAWTQAGDRLEFKADDGARRTDLELVRPVEATLWIEAPVLGRSLSRPLYAADGQLHLRLDPGVGGSERVIRARIGMAVHYASLDTGSGGLASIGFAELGLGTPGDPVRVVFEALVPGSAGDLDARAELSAVAWVWPGLTGAQGSGDLLPAPANYVAARSAGLRRDGGALHVDHRVDVDAPILGIEACDGVLEFRLAVRGDRLWHVRVGTGDQVRVPRGARLVFGHANRHDTLSLKSDDREADVIVLGEVIRRPFFARSRYDIGAGILERGFARRAEDAGGADDRVVLRRKDGRHDLLARIVQVDDPAQVVLVEEEGAISLALTPRLACDALVVRIETATGELREGAEAFSFAPVDAPLPDGVAVGFDALTRRLTVRIAHRVGRAPGIARFFLRGHDGGVVPLTDADGAQFALGLDGTLPAPDIGALVRLAGFLAEPAPGTLGGQAEAVLGPHYAATFAAFGAARMVGQVKRVLNLERGDGRPPRHDLVGVAPWVFEAGPIAFAGLTAGSGLSPLSAMATVAAPALLPDPRGDAPLAAWLDRLQAGEAAPPGLDAAQLANAFRALRYRLRETELRLLVAGSDAAAAGLITNVFVDTVDRLRAFDDAGGGDARAARIAATLERFARAASLRGMEPFLERLAFRTGLPRLECGRILTLMLRAGPETFGYFRILWHHAAAAEAARTDQRA